MSSKTKDLSARKCKFCSTIVGNKRYCDSNCKTLDELGFFASHSTYKCTVCGDHNYQDITNRRKTCCGCISSRLTPRNVKTVIKDNTILTKQLLDIELREKSHYDIFNLCNSCKRSKSCAYKEMKEQSLTIGLLRKHTQHGLLVVKCPKYK